jgi:hypothetical protein
MKKHRAFIVAVGIIIALYGCVTHELEIRMSGARMLSQGELEHLFYAERLADFSSPEGAASVTYHSDGRQEIEWASGQDTGRFRIENEQFCSTWTKLRKGEESCSKIYWISDKEYEFISSDGTYAATMRLR